MSRQVASKAVTNTKYGEGSINFAVQPDDFMGMILSSFLPVTEEGDFYDSLAFTNRGFGYYDASNTIVDTHGATIGYWEVRNGAGGRLGAALTATGSTYQSLTGTAADCFILLADNQVTAATWGTVNGAAVSASNLGHGILGSATDGVSDGGFYFTYNSINAGAHKLLGVTTFGSDSTFTTIKAAVGTVVDKTVCIQYENGVTEHNKEPGRVYGYITNPTSGVDIDYATLTSIATYEAGVATGYTSGTAANSWTGSDTNTAGKVGVTDTQGTPVANKVTLNIGGAKKHVFNEPVAVADAYPSFTLRVGREAKEHTFTGMVSTRLSLSANLNEYVMASVDWVGQAEAAPSAIQEGVTFSGNDVDALHFSGAELYVDGRTVTNTKIQSISLEININRDIDSAYAVGKNTIQRIPPSRTREITGSMEFNEIVYNDTSLRNGIPSYEDLAGAKDGAVGQTEVHKLHSGNGRPALKLKFQDAVDADHMEIDLYNVRFEAPEASVSGRDPARMSVNFQAFYDSKAAGSKKAIQIKMKGAQLSTSVY